MIKKPVRYLVVLPRLQQLKNRNPSLFLELNAAPHPCVVQILAIPIDMATKGTANQFKFFIQVVLQVHSLFLAIYIYLKIIGYIRYLTLYSI